LRKLHILLLLALPLAFLSASAYVYHMPVIVQSTSSPEVLMPGDTAVLTIELANGAAQYGVSERQGLTLSTPINTTKLRGTKDIEVLSGDYDDIGMIGPNDKIVLYYKIKANDSLPEGTYFLDLNVKAGYDSSQISRRIPIKVDTSELSLSRAELPGMDSISLDVANPRANTLSAVSVIPAAKGVIFSPEKYYIGTMDPDEVFTISFGLSSENPERQLKGPVNLSFQSQFKNGETWHQSQLYSMVFSPPPDGSGSRPPALLGGGVLLLAAAGGYVLWRRKHRSDSEKV
jgi:hypothetical protein